MIFSFVILCLQTLVLWFLILFLHRQKSRFTLVPLYVFIGVLTLLTHNFSDLGFAVITNGWYFLIASFSFFTTLMLGILILYLFEGPRATRLAFLIVLATSFFYIGIVILTNLETNTSVWVTLSSERFRYYFWSIFAIILDILFIPIFWELLGKIKFIPLYLRTFLVILVTFFLDSFIFVTGVFLGKPEYLSVIKGNLSIRLALALIANPVVGFFFQSEGYKEENRKKPKNFWEILNFRTDLENKIKTMEEAIAHAKELETKLQESQERYSLAVEGVNSGIWDWDILKNEIIYSTKFHSLLGFDPGELSTTIEDFKKMLHPEDLKRTFDLLEDCFKNKKMYSIEYRLKNKDGSYKWYLCGGVIKFNSLGKPVRMVGSIIDIDEKKNILKSLEEKIYELEQFNKLMVNRELKMAELKTEIEKFNTKISSK